ncbi:hypothetical protein BJX99DRAFT_236412 [Aspergillus californicus]
MAMRFETNGLYLLLSDRGDISKFHWGLYLATSPLGGQIGHLVNRAGMVDWQYESTTSQNDATPNKLLLALKLADLDPALHDALMARMSQIPIQYSTRFRESMTCRVWIKEALYELDDEGYIELTESVDKIEADAKTGAIINKAAGRQTVAKCKGTIA